LYKDKDGIIESVNESPLSSSSVSYEEGNKVTKYSISLSNYFSNYFNGSYSSYYTLKKEYDKGGTHANKVYAELIVTFASRKEGNTVLLTEDRSVRLGLTELFGSK